MPEGDVVRDLLGRVLRLRVVPARIFVRLPVDHDVVVARRALPGTDRVRLALAHVLPVYRVGRKILIAFDLDRALALGEHRSVPRCTSHIGLLWSAPASCRTSKS